MDSRRLPFTRRTGSGTIRHAARPFLDGYQDDEQVQDSLLVITELVQNVMRHTGDGGDLVLSRHDNAVLIEVADGSGDMPEALDSDPRRDGGRGLLLVRALSQAWGAQRTAGGKVVWAEMAAASPSP